MPEEKPPIDRLIYDLRERAKELNCLYLVQEILNQTDKSIDEICRGIVEIIPSGWQYPDVCLAEIHLRERSFQSPGFSKTPWVLSSNISIQEEIIGSVSVYYSEERPAEDEGPFLKEERKLIDSIAEQFGMHLLHLQLREVFHEQKKIEEERKSGWWVILDLLKRTDPKLLIRISRKMINYLYRKDIKEAEPFLKQFTPLYGDESQLFSEANAPYQISSLESLANMSDEVFIVAGKHLDELEILDNIQKWIKEDRSGFLVDVLVNPASSLEEISSAIGRYHHLVSQGLELSPAREKWFRIALIRRILSDRSEYIDVAKNFITVDDFNDFMHRVIFPGGSHGKLGGKSSGLFLAAQILDRYTSEQNKVNNVRTPKTWYLTSDSIFYFMSFNNLEDIIEQKYKGVDQIRQEYPYVVNIFKNSPLPPEIIKGLSLALDDFGDVPLIVRSSSLLEDRTGTAFAGKYKSLFISNIGTKEERLIKLVDAITEVYASMFGPDPIEYRYKHGLVEHHEEMGIMIQEVVGKRIGPYYFPVFAGVAFSTNEFRWSSRIRREDGLVRLVPGLGTRAVDRLSDDYPILISPGQPNLRTNVTLDEIAYYSPKMIDVINIESGTFETISIIELLGNYQNDIPDIHHLISVIRDDRLQSVGPITSEYEKDEVVITFNGLIARTEFLEQLQSVLNILQNSYGYPVDIEFAHDGSNFYLLQCRSQSHQKTSSTAVIPTDIPDDQIIFTANRYISNAMVTNITHIVYIDPKSYAEIKDIQDLLVVGRVVGRLNQILPKRQFILMGPGRWGSRGDIRLGVNVTYSDINNTTMLVEIARKQRDYMPDPSFGTHFFQDLVEASIHYLPLYPESSGIIFNEPFFESSKNILADVLPEYSHFEGTIRVIEIEASFPSNKLQVLMNAEEGLAIGYLAP